jgi:hypothetical protein
MKKSDTGTGQARRKRKPAARNTPGRRRAAKETASARLGAGAKPGVAAALRSAGNWVRTAIAVALPKRSTSREDTSMTDVIVPVRKRGRPKGSKDKQPRKRRTRAEIAAARAAAVFEPEPARVVALESRRPRRRKAGAQENGAGGSLTEATQKAARGRRRSAAADSGQADLGAQP